MLKDITVLRGNEVYLHKEYAISFKNPEVLPQLLKSIDEEVTSRRFYDENLVIDIITLKIICYKIKTPIPLFFSLTYDDSSLPEQITPKLHKLIKVITNFLTKNDISGDKLSAEKKEDLEAACSSTINDLLKLRPAKISVIGYDFTGKSSICEMLHKGSIPQKYKETTHLEKYKMELFGMPILLWDIPDQGDISDNVWRSFILGSDPVILVLDSSKENTVESKKMIELTDEIIPHAELLIIANKQDSEEALKPKEIEDILQCKVLPFIAADSKNISIIQIQTAKLLEIKAEGIDYSKEDYIIQRND